MQGIHQTYSLNPDRHLQNKIDFMNIEVGSKYSVGNEMEIADNNKVITFDDVYLTNNDDFLETQRKANKYGRSSDSFDNINRTNAMDESPDKLRKRIDDSNEDFDDSDKSSEKYGHNRFQKIPPLVPTIDKTKLKHNGQFEKNFLEEYIHGRNNMDLNETLIEGSNQVNKALTNTSKEQSEHLPNPNTNWKFLSDPIKQIKINVINSLKYYNDKVKTNTTLFNLDNFQVNLIKKSKVLDDGSVLNARNMSDDELDEHLIDNFMRTIQSHQINMEFANTSVESGKEGVLNNFVSVEGRGKKKKKGDGGIGLACSVALAMTLAGLMFIKMITLKAMLLSLLSLLISFSMKKGGGLGRQIEAKYQTDLPAALTAPVCNCKCSGERNNHPAASSAYKYYNEHKNAIITVDADGNEIEHHNDGTEYLPQIAFKNLYVPGNPLHNSRYERRQDGATE
ncbi:hypothetical protein M8J75_004157 [Diaphorina citri]|nr:hypothetical protein M8J75_004157 [Diaphorina citri]KAI5715916.1 hypothetical protein M8J77_024524 [Diaphorina citri]